MRNLVFFLQVNRTVGHCGTFYYNVLNYCLSYNQRQSLELLLEVSCGWWCSTKQTMARFQMFHECRIRSDSKQSILQELQVNGVSLFLNMINMVQSKDHLFLCRRNIQLCSCCISLLAISVPWRIITNGEHL